MKSFWKKLLLLLAATLTGATIVFAEKPSTEGPSKPEAQKTDSGTNGEGLVTLDSEAQKLIGLKTATVAAATAPHEVKAYGQVLDPTPLVTLLSEIASARASINRIQPGV